MRQERPIWPIKFCSLVSGHLVDRGLKCFGTCRQNKEKYKNLLVFFTGKTRFDCAYLHIFVICICTIQKVFLGKLLFSVRHQVVHRLQDGCSNFTEVQKDFCNSFSSTLKSNSLVLSTSGEQRIVVPPFFLWKRGNWGWKRHQIRLPKRYLEKCHSLKCSA